MSEPISGGPASTGAAPGVTDTEVARLLEENHRLRAELARMTPLAEVGLLSAGAAHDLNNLLQLISGNASQLRPGDESDRALLRRLETATDSACELTHRLARWGREPAASAGRCDLADTLAQVADLAEPAAPEGARVRIEAASGLPPAAIAPGAAHRIVLNLLLNGWQALRGQPGEVVLRCGAEGRDRVWVEVEDTGGGLSDEARERLFEPFFSEHASGSGLGLTTIRQLTDSAGGEIGVWSATGRGARFRVTLPAHAVSGSAPA